jgi:branched-chain amino acid aminotransferase
VVLVPWVRNERSAVAGVKTTSYAENVVALAHAKANGAGEALFANTVGQLCEGTGSNVFLVMGGDVVTPPLSSGCLAGVTRALLIEWADVVERDLPTGALLDADEVFLTSSTRDVQAVHAVGDRELPPGPVTQRLAALFAERAAEDLDP